MKHTGVAVAVLGLLLAGCFPWKSEPKKQAARLVPCHRATSRITIDGKLDEPAWSRAYLVETFTVPPNGARPIRPTSARLLWDDDNLYLAVVMEDFDITAVKKEHDANTWEDDVCELFVKPSETSPAYYEIHVTPLGTVLDLLFGRRGAGTLDRWKPWESDIKAAIAISGTLNNWEDKDKGWVVEAAIPLKSFTRTTPKPQLGDRWRFAVCRYNYSVYLESGLECTSSAALSQTSFHHYEDYDFLEFAE